MSETYDSGVITHYCTVEVGESIDNMNRNTVRIEDDDDYLIDYMFSGRVVHKVADEGNIIASLGWKEGTNDQKDSEPAYIVHRGVDHADVMTPTNMKNLIGRTGVGNAMSVIPIRDGIIVQTSEYLDDSEPDLLDEIWVVTDHASNDDEVVGLFGTYDCLDENADVSQAFGPVGRIVREAANVSHDPRDSDKPYEYKAWDLNLMVIEFPPVYQLSTAPLYKDVS